MIAAMAKADARVWGSNARCSPFPSRHFPGSFRR
jgi:hypothetical protein